MRYWLICAADWADHYLLRHGFHRLCDWLGDHPWWETRPPDTSSGAPIWRGWVLDDDARAWQEGASCTLTAVLFVLLAIILIVCIIDLWL